MAKRILVVDDDEMVLMALGELLRPEGYEVRTVSSGNEALKSLDQMDGFELCKRIRERENYGERPILFLTAKSRDEDRVQGLEAGANLFISKPISPDKLLKIITDTIG